MKRISIMQIFANLGTKSDQLKLRVFSIFIESFFRIIKTCSIIPQKCQRNDLFTHVFCSPVLFEEFYEICHFNIFVVKFNEKIEWQITMEKRRLIISMRRNKRARGMYNEDCEIFLAYARMKKEFHFASHKKIHLDEILSIDVITLKSSKHFFKFFMLPIIFLFSDT